MPRVIYDPKDSVSDASALQAAVTQAGAGGRVDIAEGRVLLNATIQINAPLMLTGTGAGTVLVRAPRFAGNLLELRGARGMIIRDFSVLDACSSELAQADVGAHVINLWNCPDSVIENVQIRRGFRGGILISECDNVTVAQCLVEDCLATPMPPVAHGRGGHGITVYARQGQICRNVKISHCTLRRNWRTGIFLTAATGVRVEGCDLVDNMPKAAFDAGIECGGQICVWADCYDIVIADNQIDAGYDSQGVELDVTQLLAPGTAHHISVIGNTIRRQGRTGVLLYTDPNTVLSKRAARVVITGNIIEDSTQRNNFWYGGITATKGVSDFLIVGNLIRESGQAAVKLHGENLRWCMVGNHLESTAATVFFDGNRNAAGVTTGQIGASVYVANAPDTYGVDT